MRLICPTCEAKYEVPEDAIPDTGRDVQCANCGHGWFQRRPRHEPAVAGIPEVEPTDAASVAPETAASPAENSDADPVPPLPAVDAFPEDGQEIEADLQVEPVPEPSEEPLQSAEEPSTVTPYAVDEGVLAILREEAEREAQARRAEAGSLENQPDLGIDAALPAKKGRKVAAADPSAEAHVASGPSVDAEDKPAARRDLLPDVEEINSTLRPSESEGDAGADIMGGSKSDEGGGGFRSGFLLVISLAVLGAAVYVTAPLLSEMVPALTDPLAIYVAAVDSFRSQLDGLMQMATRAINGQ